MLTLRETEGKYAETLCAITALNLKLFQNKNVLKYIMQFLIVFIHLLLDCNSSLHKLNASLFSDIYINDWIFSCKVEIC